jgi:hypothetical protein
MAGSIAEVGFVVRAPMYQYNARLCPNIPRSLPHAIVVSL